MRIAVAGGSGLVGQYVVELARASGHDVVVLARGAGVDVRAGDGVAEALAGAEVIIDVLNTTKLGERPATDFFTTTTATLQRAGAAAGIRHLVTLSILGIDDVPHYGYYRAKLAQERAAEAGPVPATILRAAQFHEFPAQVIASTRRGPIAVVPRMRSQPVAARTVAEHLLDAATRPAGSRRSVAGPQVHDIAELARRVVRARQDRVRVLAVRLPGAAGREMLTDALLAQPDTALDGPDFDTWLAGPDSARVPLRRR